MAVNRGIEHQHIVLLIQGRIDKTILLLEVGGIQVDQLIVFVRLRRRHLLAVLVQGKIGVLRVFKQGKFLPFLVKLLLGDHAVLHK